MNSGPFPLQSLPRDILILLFSACDLIQELVRFSLISRFFYRLIQVVSRRLIQQYFPYLLKTNTKECKIFPKTLFAEELRQYRAGCRCAKNLLFGLDIHAVLLALKGAIDEIERSVHIDKSNKVTLYCLALSNGHTQAVAKLNLFDIELALQWATRKGNLEVVQWLLDQFPADDETSANDVISNIVRGWAFLESAKYGHLAVLQCLFARRPSIFSIHKEQALTRAAKYGHLDVVQWLLAQAGRDMKVDFNELSLLAFQCGYRQVALTLKKYQWQVLSPIENTFIPSFSTRLPNNHTTQVPEEIELINKMSGVRI